MQSKAKRPASARLVLAESLRRLRAERGWSQDELAAKSGLHRTYVGSVERGERNVSIDNIEKLARALSCPICDLLGGGGV
jgi:transcriptional regulator with XRE-family HTH domain